MPRLIFASVGLQPGAILASLKPAGIRPEAGDRLVLLCTRESVGFAERILAMLGTGEKILCDRHEEMPTHVMAMLDAWRDAADFLLHGFSANQMMTVIRAARARSEATRMLVGRIGEPLLGFRVDDGVGAIFPIEELRLAELLEVLGLRWQQPYLVRSRDTRQRLGPILGQPAVRKGALELDLDMALAAVPDGAGTPAEQRRNLTSWVRSFNDLDRLHRFGLDRRNLCIANLPQDKNVCYQALRRAEEDGLRLHPSLRQCSRRQVQEPVPAGGGGGDIRRHAAPNNDAWRFTDLLVVVGTNPDATLRSIAGLKPRCVWLLCDPDSTEVQAVRRRIMDDARLHCQREVVDCPKRDAGLVGTLTGLVERMIPAGPLTIDLTAGDKTLQTALALVGTSRRQSRLYVQQETAIISLDLNSQLPAMHFDLPVASWIWHHTGMRVKIANRWHSANPPPDLLLDLLNHLPDDIPPYDGAPLARLWKRRGPLRIDLDAGLLHWPHLGAIPFAKLRAEICPGFLDALLPDQKHGENTSHRGDWWEWLVAAALHAAGLDEVAFDSRIAPYGPHFRDQLDVVSRHRGQFALWSCKTLVEKRFREKTIQDALNQGERLLGRYSRSIVAVVDSAGGWDPGGAVTVVTLKDLRNADRLQQLASAWRSPRA